MQHKDIISCFIKQEYSFHSPGILLMRGIESSAGMVEGLQSCKRLVSLACNKYRYFTMQCKANSGLCHMTVQNL